MIDIANLNEASTMGEIYLQNGYAVVETKRVKKDSTIFFSPESSFEYALKATLSLASEKELGKPPRFKGNLKISTIIDNESFSIISDDNEDEGFIAWQLKDKS